MVLEYTLKACIWLVNSYYTEMQTQLYTDIVKYKTGEADCYIFPFFTSTPQSLFEPSFESKSTGADLGYIHTGSNVVGVNNCIPEVFYKQ